MSEICEACGHLHPKRTIDIDADANGEYFVRLGDEKQSRGDDWQMRCAVAYWMDFVWCLEHQLARLRAAMPDPEQLIVLAGCIERDDLTGLDRDECGEALAAQGIQVETPGEAR